MARAPVRQSNAGMTQVFQESACYRSDSPSWHVVYTSPQCEQSTADEIKRIGLVPYLPLEHGSKIVRRRRVQTTRPLFPRYLFVGVETYQHWRGLLGVEGVEDVLRNNDIPSRVPTAWVDMLRKMEGAGAFDRRPGVKPFELGEIVRISDGIYSGYKGRIMGFLTKMSSMQAHRRAKVMLEMLGTIELDVIALEPTG